MLTNTRLDSVTLRLLEDCLVVEPTFVRLTREWPLGPLQDRLADRGLEQALEAVRWALERDAWVCGPWTSPCGSDMKGHWWWYLTHEAQPNFRHHVPSQTNPFECRSVFFPNPLQAWQWLLEEWGRWDLKGQLVQVLNHSPVTWDEIKA